MLVCALLFLFAKEGKDFMDQLFNRFREHGFLLILSRLWAFYSFDHANREIKETCRPDLFFVKTFRKNIFRELTYEVAKNKKTNVINPLRHFSSDTSKVFPDEAKFLLGPGLMLLSELRLCRSAPWFLFTQSSLSTNRPE